MAVRKEAKKRGIPPLRNASFRSINSANREIGLKWKPYSPIPDILRR